MTTNDTLTILAALYALDNERDSYEYRVKLARSILHSMGTVPGKPEQELTYRLKALISQTPRGCSQAEISLYKIMEAYIEFVNFGIDMPVDCPVLNALIETIGVAHAKWEEAGKAGQLEIVEIVTGCGYDE